MQQILTLGVPIAVVYFNEKKSMMLAATRLTRSFLPTQLEFRKLHTVNEEPNKRSSVAPDHSIKEQANAKVSSRDSRRLYPDGAFGRIRDS